MLSIQPLLLAGTLVLAYLLFTLGCYRKRVRIWRHQPVLNSGVPVNIVAYASESGQARALAGQLAEQTGAPCLTLNELSPAMLANCRQLLLIVSTTGEGDAPDNGRLLLPRLAQADVAGLSFAVLALGDRHYRHFCAFGLRLAAVLQARGATPLFPAVCVDQLDPQALQQWQQQLQQLGFKTATVPPAGSGQQAALTQESLWRLQQRQLLNAASPGAPVYDITLQAQNTLPDWQAGDIAQLRIPDAAGGTVQREYTIASLPQEQQLRLLIRVQHYPDGRPGIGSGWLCQQAQTGDSIALSIRSNPAFHAPAARVPLILIGNGTGLAGLRAHLQQRELHAADSITSGKNWLIFGERSPEHDRPWRQQLEHWLNTGHLQQLDLAFSRMDQTAAEPQAPDRLSYQAGRQFILQGYVQQVLSHHAGKLQQWLAQGACLYVCGSRNGMAAGVDDALSEILGEQQRQALIEEGRYRRDVY